MSGKAAPAAQPVELRNLVRPGLIFPNLAATDRWAVLRELADLVAETGMVGDAEALCEKLREREELGSTATGGGVAIPHCKLAGLEHVVVAVGVCPEGIDFGGAEGELVKLFFLLLSPEEAPAAHLQSLAAISRWVKKECPCDRLFSAGDPDLLFQLLQGDSVG
ncbi:MAG: PTS sugar transporter subunit IIA [Acidobacteriota bacterium]|nr:PTS sugar transporter subunit IIA [Acidobacteriota bacterium]